MIQPAHPLHAPWLEAVHHAVFPPPEAWSASTFAAQLALPGVFGLMDEAGALLLARVTADEAEILTLAVLAEHRRRGVARALLLATHAAAARTGARSIYLEVSETNEPALRLYADLLYQPAGRRRAYYPDGTDALVLKLTLDHAEATTP